MISRRQFLAATSFLATPLVSAAESSKKIGLTKPELPFGLDALAPVISAETLRLHHGAHHVGYYNGALALASKMGLSDLPLNELLWRANSLRETSADGVALYNASAQVLNHDLYWRSLAAPGSDATILNDEPLRRRIDRDFGSFAALRKTLTQSANGQFGSGWCWLVADKKGNLSVIATSGADCPVLQGYRVLLTIDVWEHAYYVDYRNKRATYVDAVIKDSLNWASVAEEFSKI